MSQRLIVTVAPTLLAMGMVVELRDVTQAYPQSKSELHRVILAKLPADLEDRYLLGTIMQVVKPLYGITEAGVHWWTTYHNHHRNELGIQTSIYDLCLLITNNTNSPKNRDRFGLVGMQTDDTLILSTTAFSATEEEKI